jgi:phosphinothricin acetyltransferase
MPPVQIEPASLADAAAIAAIYAHHVLHGTASYEIEPPGTEEMVQRMRKVLGSGWPWLAARGAGGDLLGYAYASQFRDRPAYRYVCENSIYIRHDQRGQGIGKALLTALLDACQAQGFRQMIAVIGGAEPASVALHAAAGFTRAGTMRAIGRKQGRWLDTVYMQRELGEGRSTPPPLEPDQANQLS